MTHILVFNLILVAACLYAFWAGGAPERATALVFLIAATASYLRPYTGSNAAEPQLALIDALTLVALTIIAVKANRFWPMYQSALQLLTLAIHGVKLVHPGLAHWMYINAYGKLAYPTLALLAIGVLRHRRRIVVFGSDRDWSSRHATTM